MGRLSTNECTYLPTYLYEVVWEHEETGEGSTTKEAGRAGAGGGGTG